VKVVFCIKICLLTLQGAALGAMVGFLTYGNKKFHHLDAQMRRLLEPLYKTMKDLIPFIDADAAAFNDFMVDAELWLPHAC
jgi:glutamate formiminotransferase/formiminotetrahydrofolate cyclodeaminase